MISHYAVNIQGPSHVTRDIPCQDSFSVREARGGAAVIAAVADGLGSESHSDVGSSIAASTAVGFVAAVLEARSDEFDRLALIHDAFYAAYDAVLDEAERLDELAGEFDCTLTLAVLEDGHLWWGHSGDSGLMVAHLDGSYELVTTMQRDKGGRVYPLCFDHRWEFGEVKDVSSALLCTDGVLEAIAPPVLGRLTNQPIDTKLVRMFLHPQEGDTEHIAEVEKAARAYWEAYPQRLLDDDKTVVVLFDDERLPAEQDQEYYAGPNWDEVNRLMREALYGTSKKVTPQPESEPQAPQSTETLPPSPANAPLTEPSAPKQPVAPKPVEVINKTQVADIVGKAIDVGITCAAVTIACGSALGNAAANAIKDFAAKQNEAAGENDDRLRPHKRTDRS